MPDLHLQARGDVNSVRSDCEFTRRRWAGQFSKYGATQFSV